jgi:hypothetical protein
MARGFESKDVEFQQAEASRPKAAGADLTPQERQRRAKRSGVELALAQARAERARARNQAHQRMLDEAIQTLERQLRDTLS